MTRKRVNEILDALFWVAFIFVMAQIVLSPAFYENTW